LRLRNSDRAFKKQGSPNEKNFITMNESAYFQVSPDEKIFTTRYESAYFQVRRKGALSWLPKILYLVGWVRRGDTFDDKLITFAPRRNPPEDYL
jgi:hypothetical protein